MQVEILIMFLLAYLLGSIPSGVWIGKLVFKKDIREYGSGNTGTTNAFRVFGAKAGIVVLLMDLLKGTAAGLLPMLFGLDVHPMLVGFFAIIGHVFPVFANFKGGKAVATSAGVALAYNPLFLIGMLLIFFVILYVSSMVSLASVSALVIGFLLSLTLQDWIFSTAVFIIMVLIILRHKDNLKRIKEGTENLVPFGINYKKKQQS